MTRLKTLEQKVRAVLELCPCTRDDDRELALRIWTDFYGVSAWAPIVDVMRRSDIPSQESIGRCRRKIQETEEHLRGSKAKEQIRYDAQKDFIEYANNNYR